MYFLNISVAVLIAFLTGLFNPEVERNVSSHNNVGIDSLRLDYELLPVDTPPKNPNNHIGDPITRPKSTFFIGNPSNMNVDYELDEEGEGYYITEKIGDQDIRSGSYISVKDYLQYRETQAIRNYWKSKNGGPEGDDQMGGDYNFGKIDIASAKFNDIFGEGGIQIRPTGSALLEFSGDINRMANPALPIRQQRTGNFNFDQNIQMNVVGKIGSKLRLTANWDTQAAFDFENQFKIEYIGNENEIIQEIQGGNVSLPLKGSLIQGGQNLFGVKVGLKFGPMTVTTVASQQKGKQKSISIKGGSQVTEFEKEGNEYQENRMFFLGHHFRNRYNYALSKLPNVNSTYNFTRIEVWITNTNSQSTSNNRNAVGLIDLGEQQSQVVDQSKGNLFRENQWGAITSPTAYPSNGVNALYSEITANPEYRTLRGVDSALVGNLGLENGVDFEKVENMKKLRPEEFSILEKPHEALGYVVLNTPIQANQVIFVAYEYMVNGEVYQVGEFDQDKPSDLNEILFLKMLKPSSIRPEYENKPFPTWDLAMKNGYNIGGWGLKPDNFKMDVFYKSPSSAGDMTVLPEGSLKGVPLIQVTGLDRLTNNGTSSPDNQLDFIDGITVFPDKGLVVFPVLEPFGAQLVRQLGPNPEDSAAFAFPQLYSETRMDAIQLHQNLDRYVLKGSYASSSSSEISLNAMNIAEGSVVVTADGITLTEGVDYKVETQLGKVVILNQGLLTSGQEIKVSYETQTLFGIQSKTLVGSRFDFDISDDVQLGATILHLNELPMTQKLIIGDEPISNTIIGADWIVRKDSRFITKLVDMIPGINTNEISSINAAFEGATLLPGHPKAIQNKLANGEKEDGVAYLDDFESSKNTFSLKGASSWRFASFPGNNGNNQVFDPTTSNPLSKGHSRGKLSWYSIDTKFFNSPGTIKNYKDNIDKEDHYSRLVLPTEVFPNKSQQLGAQLFTFDLTYNPSLRGPYNYQDSPVKLNTDGTFLRPEENWGGIMRRTNSNTDFEAQNYEYLEFWVMDPFIDDPDNDGYLYIDLGKISEDVLPDNRRSYEHGLPETGVMTNVDTTAWGIVSTRSVSQNAFSNDPVARPFQDVGLDGLTDANEQDFFADFLSSVTSVVDAVAAEKLLQDPSSDNFKYFLDYEEPEDDVNGDGHVSIRDRYLEFNNQQNNSPIDAVKNGISQSSSATPDLEDMNVNGTLNTAEEYWEYKIKIKKSDFVKGSNYVVDKFTAQPVINGVPMDENWYQFRIPLNSGTPIGNISNFKSIDFVRAYMTGFEKPVTLRFATLELVSTSWRSYKGYLGKGQATIDPEPPENNTSFELGTVNIEENGITDSFPYIIPPYIVRQQQTAAITMGLLDNEQALSMKVCNLEDGDARGAYRIQDLDLRSYKKLKMWVHGHGETPIGGNPNFENKGDLRAFIRVGTDNVENYYEYEIPLTPTIENYAPEDQNNPLPEDDPVRFVAWANEFNFEMDLFFDAKAKRDEVVNSGGNDFIKYRRFGFSDASMPEGDSIFVIGTPKVSDISSIMIGIRNPDDGNGPVCAQIWMNELRTVDFNEKMGYAGTARVNLKLADFGNVSLSGSYRSPGFGGLEQKINSRSREETYQYDLAGNFQLGKFFPDKWGMDIPLYMTYGTRVINPQFDPREPDVEWVDRENTISDPVEKEQQRAAIQTVSTTRSVSLNNVRKNRIDNTKKPKPWDVENFALSFSVSESKSRDSNIDSLKAVNQKAGIKYNHNFNPKNVKLFKKAKKKNPLTILNFYYLPKNLSFALAGDRRYEYKKFRSNFGENIEIAPIYFRDFRVTRTFNMRWDLTQSLGVTFSSNNIGRVDEPLGEVNDSLGNADSLWNNLLNFNFNHQSKSSPDSIAYFDQGKDKMINLGRNVSYTHNIGVDYRLPFDKFPWTNFINSSINYQGNLGWIAGPDNNPLIGNILNNGMNVNANARLSMDKFYDKIPFLKKLNAKGKSKNKSKQSVRNTITPKKGTAAKDSDDKDKDDTFSFWKGLGKELGRVLIGVKNVDVSFTRTEGTQLPGYLPNTDNFGLDFQHYYYPEDDFQYIKSSSIPPTFPFIAGWQLSPEFLLKNGTDNGWLTQSDALSASFNQNRNDRITGRASVKIFRDLKIDLNLNWSKGKRSEGLIRYDDLIGEHVMDNYTTMGDFSVSHIFLGSAFDGGKGNTSKTFTEFNQNARRDISSRLYNNRGGELENLTDDGYQNGYYRNSQEVLIPAFLGSYGGASISTVSLNPFGAMPLPNWSVNYNGLSKIKSLKKVFNSFTIKHTYRGSYSLGNYNSNVLYDPDNPFDYSGLSVGVDLNNDTIYNYRPEYQINTISMTESFSPLIGLDVNFKNGFTSRLDLKTDRQVSLNIGQGQVTETKSKDVTLGIGWRKDRLNKTLKIFGKTLELKNALNARLDFTLRDRITLNRLLDDEGVQVTGGNFSMIINPSVDYAVNDKVNVQAFVETNINRPKISTSFPTTFTRIGFKVQFTL